MGIINTGYNLRGSAMSDFAVGYASSPDVKSKQFGFESMFPRKENIDEMFSAYFKQNLNDGFVDLHGEMQRLDLRG